MSRYLVWLLSVAAVLVTMSCGTRPAGPVAPAAVASSGKAATSAAPAATAARSREPATVVFGVIMAAPACPADRVAHACRPHPLAGVRVQADLAGAPVVSSSLTGADGHYSFRVVPGRYVLVVVAGPASLRCRQVLVAVFPGTAIRTNLTCAASLTAPPVNPA